MSTDAIASKACPPKFVISAKALKLAEKWVDGMSKSLEDEDLQDEYEGRPSRVGLGAKIAHHLQGGPLNDLDQRKFLAYIKAGKRKATQLSEEIASSCMDTNVASDDEDEDSRVKVFSKKRAASLTTPSQRKKR